MEDTADTLAAFPETEGVKQHEAVQKIKPVRLLCV